MKNVEQIFKTIITKASSALMIAVCSLLATVAYADITNPSASTMDGYTPGMTSTVVFDVQFETNTLEYADFVEFHLAAPIAGISLNHGIPSPSPYAGCGNDLGDEMTGTGPGWGRPGFIMGDSGCGAFADGTPHEFGIQITSDGVFDQSFDIVVRLVGDGFGEIGASVQTVTVTIPAVMCMIVCPNVAPITAPNNSCGINFNVPPPTLNGDCGATPAGFSGFFPVGDTEVTYDAVDANGQAISCTTIITVLDDEDPFVSGVQDLTYDLQAGECGYIVPQTFAITENCIDPARQIAQNENNETFDVGVNCPGGPTKYLRLYDTAADDINTELNIEEVTFGVYEAFGNPFITVNIYSVDGALTYDNMTLLGSGVDVLPDFQNALYTIPVTATIPAGSMYAVEIVVPGSIYNGVIMAMNQGPESAETYIASDFCGFTEPTTLANIGFPGFATVVIIDGYETSYILTAVGSGVEVGDTVPEGVTQVDYEVEDASGNIATISFSVTVNGFDGEISAIACNDEVNISLDDESCEAIVTADQILEGGPYACYDEYTVEITDNNGNNFGDLVTADNIGETLIVTVTDPNGNSCWGTIIVEDKAPPALECMDLYTTCTGDLYPGAPISEMVTFLANITPANDSINEDVPNSNTYTIPVFGLNKATISKVTVKLTVDHTFVSDLTASLIAPDGTTSTLFLEPGTFCPGDNLSITLDDDAFNTYTDLENACTGDDPAISGSYQPAQDLSIFDGKDPNGDWMITVADLYNGEGGNVISAELVISQTGGIIGFPTDNDVISQTEGDNTYTVIGIDPCGPATLVYNDSELNQDCDSPYSKIIQRSWSAVDENGNESPGCVQTIYIYRNGLATLTFPPNYDGIQQPALSCSQFATLTPPTSVTGEPSGDLCDNVQVFPYVDTRIDICEGSYKIVRFFQLLEWCSGEVLEHNQIIKVVDDQGPLLADYDDITVSAGDHDCSATFLLEKPEVISDCSDEFTYELYYLPATSNGPPPEDEVYFDDNVLETASGNFILQNALLGDTWAKWRVFDECGNFTDIYFTITVEDQVSPVSVCDEFTVASVGSDGFVDVFATTFDDLSVDNCGIESMRARKMTNACSGANTAFGETVRFCCNEVGTSVMVEFEVTDLSGNKNTCMVEVNVQDKLPPYITECPEDITLNCQANYEDLTITGEPEFVDNCEVVSVNFEDSGSIDNCGVGLILRTWTVEDKEGFKASCVQRITLEDDDPFVENDIDWPNDYQASTCNTNLDPENLPLLNGFPRYDDDNCSLVDATYKDSHFSFVDGACEKILRKWTVIDWCTYDENNPILGEGWYEYLQIVKLVNNEGPEISNCNTLSVDVFEECEGPVEFTIEATDDCTPSDELSYSYQIDLFNDGIDGQDFNLNGNTASFNRTLVEGVHSVTWIVEDKCGNATTCTMTVIVRDGKKPTPYCQSTITTVVMNNNGMVAIWAKEFDLGSYDNCTPQDELRLSFSSNPVDTGRILTCDMIFDGVEAEVQLELWVTDNAGNQDYCSIAVIVQDSNEDVCEDGNNGLVAIEGELRTEANQQLENARVTAFSNIMDVSSSEMTGALGNYNISDIPPGSGYKVKAEKNDDVRNGVSTLDLVMIQRHILDLAPLTSPYKLIASDINNDGKLKASDLTSLRKVILGVIDYFPNGQESWRFVPEENAFDDATDPFPFVEELNIGIVQGVSFDNDLIAIKIGDINGNVETNLTNNINAESRSNETLTLEIEDAKVESGDRIEVPVYAKSEGELLGYQFTMNLGNADYVGIESGQIEMREDYIGVFENMITASWANTAAQSIDTEEPLFTLILDMNDDVQLSQLISINSKITTAEAYSAEGLVSDLELDIRNNEIEGGTFTVFQNQPNPFRESTTISFFLPKESDVKVSIMDVTGRVIMNKTQHYGQGAQNVKIDYADLNNSGVMYYTITAGENTATKKMINVR